MERITFSQVVPQVFANSSSYSGDVWHQELVLEKGRTYLLEADSGHGKSTFCSYVLGYRSDYSGRLLFDSRDARQLRVGEWTQLRLSHVSCLFQELRLFPELTALENVLIKNTLTRYKSLAEITSWFEMLGIGDKLHTPVSRLSFGQQQRVAMMRSLVQPFDFLLADEPISHLDDENAATMSRLMLSEVRRQGAGVVVTSIGKHTDIAYERRLRL